MYVYTYIYVCIYRYAANGLPGVGIRVFWDDTLLPSRNGEWANIYTHTHAQTHTHTHTHTHTGTQQTGYRASGSECFGTILCCLAETANGQIYAHRAAPAA